MYKKFLTTPSVGSLRKEEEEMGGDDGLVRQASGKVEEKEVVKDAQGEELKVNDE